jgi:putative salt-induced outer membrane protein YdiY
MLLALALSTVLAQSDAAATPTVPPEKSPAERAADAAVKAAEAAQKAAEAALRIADAVAPAPAAAAATPAAPAADAWKGSVGLGLTFITGNAQTLTVTGTAAADKKWDAWSMGIRLSGAYGLANPDTNTVGTIAATTARRGAGTIRGDRAFGSGFAAIFVLAGSEFDHMKNIESRTIGEAGAGLTFFNKKEGDLEKLFLRLDIAARAGYESRFQYFPVPASVSPYGLIILAPRAAVSFRWGFSKDVRLSEEIEFIPFVLAPAAGRLLINNTTKLNARLTENLALTTAFILNFDSQPPEGAGGLKRKETDVALTVGLEAAF